MHAYLRTDNMHVFPREGYRSRNQKGSFVKSETRPQRGLHWTNGKMTSICLPREGGGTEMEELKSKKKNSDVGPLTSTRNESKAMARVSIFLVEMRA